MSSKISALILQYLAAPATKSAVVERLSQKPHEAFAAILGFRGPYPKKIHPIDVHEEYLAPLLASLPRPFILIAAAIEANDPRFADTMLASLNDRSIDVKMAVVHAIRQCSFLHTPKVRQQLQSLMATKSIAKDAYALGLFQEALRAIDGGGPEARP